MAEPNHVVILGAGVDHTGRIAALPDLTLPGHLEVCVGDHTLDGMDEQVV